MRGPKDYGSWEPSGKLLMTAVFKILIISIIIYLPSSTRILPSGEGI